MKKYWPNGWNMPTIKTTAAANEVYGSSPRRQKSRLQYNWLLFAFSPTRWKKEKCNSLRNESKDCSAWGDSQVKISENMQFLLRRQGLLKRYLGLEKRNSERRYRENVIERAVGVIRYLNWHLPEKIMYELKGSPYCYKSTSSLLTSTNHNACAK